MNLFYDVDIEWMGRGGSGALGALGAHSALLDKRKKEKKIE